MTSFRLPRRYMTTDAELPILGMLNRGQAGTYSRTPRRESYPSNRSQSPTYIYGSNVNHSSLPSEVPEERGSIHPNFPGSKAYSLKQDIPNGPGGVRCSLWQSGKYACTYACFDGSSIVLLKGIDLPGTKDDPCPGSITR